MRPWHLLDAASVYEMAGRDARHRRLEPYRVGRAARQRGDAAPAGTAGPRARPATPTVPRSQPLRGPMTAPPPEPARPAPAWKPPDARQRRLLGVLVEKAKTTPPAHPTSLNAILARCNPKSN